MEMAEDSVLPSQEILQLNMRGGEELPKRLRTNKATVKNKQKQFECKICGKAFKKKYYLQRHRQVHSELCSFNCDLCPYKGKTRKYLAQHKKKSHSKPTSNECKFCSKKFHFKSALVKHLWVHTGEKPYKCEFCEKCFNTRYSLNTHNFIHTDEKPFQCTSCNYACRDSSTLRKHQVRHTGLVKVYECKMCDKSYKIKWKLKEHVAKAHLELDVRKFVCDDCGKSFEWKANLINHVQSVHARSRACICDFCGKGLTNRGNLNSHMRRHIDVRPYQCAHRGCRKTFKTACELKKHSSIHSPQYRCDGCGRMFSRRQRRDAHSANKCRGNSKTTLFKCERCPDTKRLLSAHMKTHSAVKKEFICDSCGHVEHDKILFIEHIKCVHTDGQTQICDAPKISPESSSELMDDHQNGKKMIEDEIEVKVEVKVEPIESVPLEMANNISESYNTDGREEGILTERLAKSTIENNVKNLKKVPEKMFDEFFISRSISKEHASVESDEMKKQTNMDVKKYKYVRECVKDLLGGNKEGKSKGLWRDGRRIPERTIREETDLIETNRTEEIAYDSSSNNDHEQCKDVINEVTSGINLKLNFHQCYVCFKLFSTKSELLNHCKDHFDVCSETMLTRCPLCQYVTKKDIKRHMREKHDLELDIPFSRIKEKKHNNGASRYCFEVENTVLEVIPSVKNLNRIESMKLDKRRRELREKLAGKTRLVRKGGEWIVEKVEIDKRDYVLPVDFDYSNDEEYLEKIRECSRKAKLEGRKMLFPCNVCEKKCQSLSALKLHFRRHEKNPKPYKPKRWKHKGGIEGEKVVIPSGNRLKKPKPIVTRHKCERSLMEFYKKNIRGGDIEFCQFLKIYNRMSRENVKEFEDLETRTDFGIHNKHSSEVRVEEKA